jgi:uncharacterized protein with PIN domain
MSTCLDSWAVLAWLDGEEPAAEVVQEAFDAGRPWMSWLNIGEVAYQLERRHGSEEAARVVGRVRAAVALDDVTPERILAAAHIKAHNPIAFGDCFAAATARARAARLYTGDPGLLERDVGCEVRDLRPRR